MTDPRIVAGAEAAHPDSSTKTNTPKGGDVTRYGPRFTLLIGFDLGKPRLEIKRYRAGHYAIVLMFLEVHILIGKARDLAIDVMGKGIDKIKEERKHELL